MDIKNCVAQALAKGEISRAEATDLNAVFDKHAKARASGPGTDALKAKLAVKDAVAELQATAKRAKRLALLRAAAKHQVDTKLAQYRTTIRGRRNVGKAALALLEHYGIEGAEGFSSLVGRRKAILGRAHAEMEELLMEFQRTALSGKTPKRAKLDSIVKELFGEPSGDPSAKALADAWLKVSEKLRQRYNAAGGNVAKLEKWGLPQIHDATALLKAGREKWKGFIKDRLDISRMKHPTTGLPVIASEVDGWLDNIYQLMVTDGYSARDLQPVRRGTSALANRGAEHRTLIFKDAAAWLEYQNEFGEGNPFAAMMGHINLMSRDIAALEILGPDPDAMIDYMAETIVKDAKVNATGNERSQVAANQAVRTLKTMWGIERGYFQNPAMSKPGQGAGLMRNVITSAVLGSASLAAIVTDPIFQMMARHMAGLPVGRTMFKIAKSFTPGEKSKAVRAGLILDSAQHVLNDQARYVGTMTGIGQMLPDRVLAWSGLTPWTQGGRHAFGMEFMGVLADFSARPASQLAGRRYGRFQRALRRYGISDQDWERIRSAKLYEEDGAVFLRPQEISKVDERLAEKVLEMVLQETEYAVPNATLRGRAFLVGDDAPGTFFGEVRRSAAMFKSFPVTYMMLHGARIAAQYAKYGAGGAISYAAVLAITTTIGGMFGIWLSDLAAGRDPQPLVDEEGSPVSFLARAFLKGGGLGLLGDFLVADVNRYGGGLADTLAGPLVSTINGIRNLTVGNAFQLASGEETNFWKEALAMVNSLVPGHTLWYIRAAWERVVIDTLERMVDPAANESFGRQIDYWKRHYNTDMWWEPGQMAPSRAPAFNPLSAQ